MGTAERFDTEPSAPSVQSRTPSVAVRRRRSWATLSTIAVGICLTSIAAPGAYAEVTFEAAVQPNTVEYPGTHELTYALTMTSGAGEENFRVRTLPPFWDSPAFFGSPVGPAGPPTFAGAGSAEIAPAPPPPIPPTPEPFLSGCQRGYSVFDRYTAEVTLPPNSTATLFFPYATGAAPPWPGSDYRLTFTVDSPTGAGTTTNIITPQPIVTGQSGVRLDMEAIVRGMRDDRVRRVILTGSTDPVVREQWIRIRYQWKGPIFSAKPSDKQTSRPRRLRWVQTNKRGRFRVVTEGRKDRYYRYTAIYPSQQPDLVSDTNCWTIIAIRPDRRSTSG